MAIRVLVVGDIRLYCEGLAKVLCEDGRIDVIGTAADPGEALDCFRVSNPDVVLLDTAMRGGLSSVRQIAELLADARILALGVPDVESEIIACAEAGMAGYVPREASLDDLVQSIIATARGELHCSPRIAASLFRRVSTLAIGRVLPEIPDSLTRRELRILELIEQGLSNKDIARLLGIEVTTVKNHVHHILEKLQVRGRGEAAALMRRNYVRREAMDPGVRDTVEK